MLLNGFDIFFSSHPESVHFELQFLPLQCTMVAGFWLVLLWLKLLRQWSSIAVWSLQKRVEEKWEPTRFLNGGI